MQLPISEYLQNWYKEQGFVFTDFERAAIFWNTYLPLEDKLESLREIANTTADEGLRAQIKERLAHEAELKQGFFENNERNSVYIASSEDKAFGIHYFSTAERAAAYGKANSETAFTVHKERLDMEKDELPALENVPALLPASSKISGLPGVTMIQTNQSTRMVSRNGLKIILSFRSIPSNVVI